jgi:hypothetical protein
LFYRENISLHCAISSSDILAIRPADFEGKALNVPRQHQGDKSLLYLCQEYLILLSSEFVARTRSTENRDLAAMQGKKSNGTASEGISVDMYGSESEDMMIPHPGYIDRSGTLENTVFHGAADRPE